ncbi:MAG: hypothetical protein U0599_17070 [Vicinamibacteria bacterium]
MILGLLAVILSNGLGIFWPHRLEQLTLRTARSLSWRAGPAPGDPEPWPARLHLKNYRLQLKVGNRDLHGLDFRWVNEADVAKRETPAGLFLVERSEYGPLIGTPVRMAGTEGGMQHLAPTRCARGFRSSWRGPPRPRRGEGDREGRDRCR